MSINIKEQLNIANNLIHDLEEAKSAIKSQLPKLIRKIYKKLKEDYSELESITWDSEGEYDDEGGTNYTYPITIMIDGREFTLNGYGNWETDYYDEDEEEVFDSIPFYKELEGLCSLFQDNFELLGLNSYGNFKDLN